MTDLPTIAETTHTTHHTIHHTILDHISEIIADTRTTKIDRTSTGTTIETEGTNITTGTTRGMGFRTVMTITKIETGLTTEEDQTNINNTGTNRERKSSLNSQIRTY